MGFMESPAVVATIVGCFMSLFSNIVGQLITAYRTNVSKPNTWRTSPFS